MFLHNSLYTLKFLNNKKLNLLKNKLITPGQFLSLILPTDPYIIIGSTVVDKLKQNLFIKLWKNHKYNYTNISDLPKITSELFIQNFKIILSNFPLTKLLIVEFAEKIKSASCSNCIKNKYLLLIATIIKDHYKDGREFSFSDRQIIDKILNKYFPFHNLNGIVGLLVSHMFDNTWIETDSLVNIGYDLIEGLNNCLECAKKHLMRAKALYELLYLGYPNHTQLMFNLFTLSNKVIEEAFVLYWDILGQLDMSSCLMVGQLVDILSSYRLDIIELANKIRSARINYQLNILNIPDWNNLLIEIQMLKNHLNKEIKGKM